MAEKKKPKPGPSTGGSSTSRIKRPKGSQPLTLGTGGLRTGKVSKQQMTGTRKVVGAIIAFTPAGRAAKGIAKGASKISGIKRGTSSVPGSVKNPLGLSASRTYSTNEKLAAKNTAYARSAKGMTQKPKKK